MHDFGISLRRDNVILVMNALVYMLKIMLMTNSRDYKFGIISSLLLLIHYQLTGHPIFNQMEMYDGMLNEEPGEVSLSVLARMQHAPKVRQSRYLMDINYKLLPQFSRVWSTFEELTGEETESGYHTIPLDSDEVVATTQFFRGMIRRIVGKQFNHYSQDSSNWVSLEQATATAVLEMPPPFLVHKTLPLFDDAIAKLKQILARRWVHDEVQALLPEEMRSEDRKMERKHAERKHNSDNDDQSDDSEDQPLPDTDLPPLVTPPSPPQLADTKEEKPKSPPQPESEKKVKVDRKERPRPKKIRKLKRKVEAQQKKKTQPPKQPQKKKAKKQPDPKPPPPPRAPSVSASGRARRVAAPRPGFFEETRGFVRH